MADSDLTTALVNVIDKHGIKADPDDPWGSYLCDGCDWDGGTYSEHMIHAAEALAAVLRERYDIVEKGQPDLDAVAEAIRKATLPHSGPWETSPEEARELFRRMAQAAIASWRVVDGQEKP